MARKNKQLLPLLACALAFGLWGLNTPFISIGLQSFPVLSLLAIKYAFGAIVFGFLARKHWQKISNRLFFRLIIATLFGYVIAAFLLYEGIKLAGGLNAALLYLMAPLLLYFLSIEVLKERYNGRLLSGVVAGLLGALLIIGAPLLEGTGGKTNVLGSILILATILADVIGTILIKPALNKLPVTQMTAMRFIIAAFVFAPFLLLQLPEVSSIQLTTPILIAIGYNLIFATLAAFYFFHWGLSKISGEQSSPLYYIDPMVGAVGSIIILGEQPTALVLFGVIMIILGLYFSEGHKLKLRHLSHHR